MIRSYGVVSGAGGAAVVRPAQAATKAGRRIEAPRMVGGLPCRWISSIPVIVCFLFLIWGLSTSGYQWITLTSFASDPMVLNPMASE